MTKYLFVYFGGKMETDPKAMEKSNQEWTKWFTGMGKAMVDMGAATMPGKVVSGAGVKAAGTRPVSGYTVIQADNIDKAVALAKTCPGIKNDVQVEISEIMPM